MNKNIKEKEQKNQTVDMPLYKKLTDNLDFTKKELNDSQDIKEKHFAFGEKGKYKVCVLYIDGLVDTNIISEIIFEPLSKILFIEKATTTKQKVLDKIDTQVLWSSETTIAKTFTDVVDGCFKGDTVLFLDGCQTALLINTKGGEKRPITEPNSESVVRGPREGFTESFKTNTALIRRKIRSTDLKVEQLSVGRKTKTPICLLYLSSVAKKEMVDNIRQKIAALKVESILESGYIEQYIEKSPFSVFPTINYTEKPDVAAAKILEGRVAVVVDGTPFVLTIPMLFVESFQTAEDYYNRPLYASLIRVIRYFAYLISVFGPAIYISLTNFHQELIPTKLLISVIKAKEGTPFPNFIETLIMVVAFEFLREAGIRLPRSVGQAISIVGALIMGEAAVSAGIVGAPTVIVVAFTAVCGFMVPIQNNSSTILRFVMILFASIGGWFSISMGFVILLTYLATLQSFGVPYFDSFSNVYDLKDTVVRAPIWANAQRPVNIAGQDDMRTQAKEPMGEKEDTLKPTKKASENKQ